MSWGSWLSSSSRLGRGRPYGDRRPPGSPGAGPGGVTRGRLGIRAAPWPSGPISVLVPVTVVLGVPAPVVDVVHVVAVRHGHVAAPFAVRVGVAVVLGVALGLALVHVVVVHPVQVTVVDIVHMVAVGDRHVTASRAMGVIMTAVPGVALGA